MNLVMKYLTFIAVFITNMTWAKTCEVYDLRGFVRVQNNELSLVIAEKTGSQKQLPVFFKTRPRFSPYVNRFIQGRFVLESELQTNVKILKVFKIEDAVFDPLRQNEANTTQKIAGAECPQ